ncbi:MAG: FkbM family methyltransferase [Solirubrobacteraceae bacterium]
MAVTFTRRLVGAIARRTGRPELVSAFYGGARAEEHEAIAIAAVLAARLPPGGCYVDIGANRGQVLREAVRIAPDGEHVAFEPISALAAAVRSEFPRVDCRPLALGARAERTQFCHFTRLDGWSGLRRNPEVSDEQGGPEYFEVEVSTLDAELAGRSPHVLKIDVEGAELAVLEGGQELLARARPAIVFEHVPAASALYGYESAELWDLLHRCGYRITSVTGRGPFERDAFLAARGVVNWLATPAG